MMILAKFVEQVHTVGKLPFNNLRLRLGSPWQQPARQLAIVGCDAADDDERGQVGQGSQ